ncbi:serine hydrolase [Flavobacterium buctense]|uniref:Serine hydrolase n=1 Tax=Flavobacterium buctense TaxID=1648146 RepID=A0ABU9E570_9FLAO|nr:serine hydrolase [Flavobacterium buctense]
MKKLLLFLVTIGCTASASAQQDKRLKGIEVELNKILETTKSAGFAVAVVEGDKIIYAKGFGYRDYENKIPVDANTLFAIGSSSKAFTSAILGQLRKEEKLSFEDSPRKYIPELKFFNDNMNNNIIIKDLMCHRTGMSRHDFSWYFFPTTSKDSLVQRLVHQEPFAGVREKWLYNNFMFLTQGVIAERITGKSWEDNIKERFFKPLGMTRSNTSIGEMKTAVNAAFGYQLKKETVISIMDYYDISGMSPAGSINSSVNEMSNWMITWLNKGKFKGQQLIPEDYIQEAMSSQMVVYAGLPDKENPDIHFGNYGYGWFLNSYKGHYRVSHGGNIDGFSADVTLYPSDHIGIVVLANQDGSAVPDLVRNTISDYLLKVNKTDFVKIFNEDKAKAKKAQDEVKKKATSSKVAHTKPSHILQDYTGKYYNQGYGEFNITNQNDSLFVNFKFKKLYLRHAHYDIFEPFEVIKKEIDTAQSDGEIRFNFLTNESGEIASVKVKLEAMLSPIEFKHKPNTIKVSKEVLAKYVGDYELSGMTVKVYIKNENTLCLFVAGQPEYELLATDTHKFSFKTLEGFKVTFIEEADKTIKNVVLIQPNGNFTAKKKL